MWDFLTRPSWIYWRTSIECFSRHSFSLQCTLAHILPNTIYRFYRNEIVGYSSNSLVLCNISRLLFEVVRDWGVRVTRLSQVLDDLQVLRGYSEVQRRVTLVILDVNENFFRLGQNLDDFKWTKLTSDMQRCFTLLGPGIHIWELFNQ